MHIIFGNKRDLIPDSFTVLELDTIRNSAEAEAVTAYCVVDVIPLDELPHAHEHAQLHQELMTGYKNRDWNRCEDIITGTLRGRWNGAVDSFYDQLLTRIQQLRDQPLADDWDGSLNRP
jgi:hypothetical protein